MLQAIIFDVDGTLVDSVAIHAKAWQRAFAEFGHDLPLGDLQRQIGKGGDQLLPVFLSKAQIEDVGDSLDKRRAAILKEDYLADIKGFPDVRALFERLRRDGLRLVLASSAKEDELSVYKKKADIEGLVEEQTSSDDAERSKPHGDIFEAALDRLGGLDPAAAIVVGDTPYDAQAATKAGLRTIGVLSGGFPEAVLREAGCIAVYRDPADILARYDDFLRDGGWQA